MTEFFARARANIALSKYWGKADRALNLPAVPSLSLTLDDLVTETSAARDEALAGDHVELDGTLRAGDEATTLSAFLALVRARAGVAEGAAGTFLRVRSFNHFPTASGLASSASGYAALAAAASAAYGLSLDDHALSALARRGSASAARSVFGGWVELPAGAPGDDTTGARALFGGLLRDARDGGSLTYKHLAKRPAVLVPVGAKQGRGSVWMAAANWISTAAMPNDTIAFAASPTLSWRGRKSQMTAAATGIRNTRY